MPRSSPVHPRAAYFFGALGELMFGYDTGVIGAALLFITPEFHLTAFTQGLTVSSLLAGATVGVGCAGFLADRHGRRPVILAMAGVFIAGGLAGALAPTLGWLITARLVMGLGVGASAVVVMVYLTEIAPTAQRGRIAALGQLMVVLGIFSAGVAGYLLAPAAAWRWMIGLSVPPSLLLFVGMWFMPESPRWLTDRAATEPAPRSPWRTRFSAALDSRIRPGLIGAAGLAIFVQLLGLNAIIYYAPTVLIRVGFGQSSALAANLGIGAVNVLLTLYALTAIDRVGRRRLLLGGSAVMTVAMALLALAIANPSRGGAWVTVGAMLLFQGAFSLSWGVCVRVVISELLPQRVRGTAMGLVLVLNWLANFGVGLAFPSLLTGFGQRGTFLGFAALGALSYGFVRRWVPETKARSFEEIQHALRSCRPTS